MQQQQQYRVALYVMTSSCILTPSGKFDSTRLLQNVRYVTHLASMVDRVYTVRIVPPLLEAAAAPANDFFASLLPPNARAFVMPPLVTSTCETSIRADAGLTPREIGLLVAQAMSTMYSTFKGLATAAIKPLQKLIVATDTCVLVRPLTSVIHGIHGFTDTGPLWSICSRFSGDVVVFCEDLWVVSGTSVISQVMSYAKQYHASSQQALQSQDFAYGLVQLLKTRGAPFTEDQALYSASELAYKCAPVRILYRGAGDATGAPSVDQLLSQPMRYMWEKLAILGCPLLSRSRHMQQDPAADEFLAALFSEHMGVPTRVMDAVSDQAARLQQ